MFITVLTLTIRVDMHIRMLAKNMIIAKPMAETVRAIMKTGEVYWALKVLHVAEVDENVIDAGSG